MICSEFTGKWNEETDIVIIGSGFAGLAAAIEAKEAGSSVIIIEKMKGIGGNSTISDGVVAAAQTQMQQKMDIQDSPQKMMQDMMKAGMGLNHPALVETLVNNSGTTFQWSIDSLGVKYMDRVDQFGGHSVPRSCTTEAQSGSVIIRQLLKKVNIFGISIRTKTFLKNILVESDKRVCGVLVKEGYEYPDETSGIGKYIKANKGVIIATGGFSNDVEFRLSHDPRLDYSVDTTNKYSTKGEVLREAMQIGAMPVHLSWIQLAPFATPDEKGYDVGGMFIGYSVLPFGIIVDPTTGERFVNELGDRKQVCDAILSVGNPCIGIADQKGVNASGWNVSRALKKGVVKSFNEIGEIVKTYKISDSQLDDTIKRFNHSFTIGKDELFAKPLLSKAVALGNPPYYCVRIWPKVHHTMGGILINSKAQVVDLENRPIEGLFAAGEVTGGIHGACRLGGCAITECLVFGRIAGKNAAAAPEKAKAPLLPTRSEPRIFILRE